MDSIPTWYLVLQVAASFASVGALLVFWRQLVAMRGQLQIAREASQNENLVTLIDALQANDLVDARLTLINLGKSGTHHAEWDDVQVTKAERVCNSYDLAGLLIRHNVVPEHAVVAHWGDSIIRCHAATAAMIEELRATRGGDYWAHFEWLAGRAHEMRRQSSASGPTPAPTARPSRGRPPASTP
ncbi:MAG: hypothetical protein QOI99_1989 [Actinomycetota bacterium]|jgi:hypothetical protein|nr:hypothetical protein [Actinomycetota bacterium]